MRGMSYELVDRVLKHGPVNPGEKLVLIAVASFENVRTGICNPSVLGVAARASMTERGVRAILRRLEAAGWLASAVGGGRAGRSSYRINTEGRSGFPDENTEHGSGFKDENTERHAAKPGTSRHKTRNETAINPERRSPEPVENQEENQEENQKTEGAPLSPFSSSSDAEAADFATDAAGSLSLRREQDAYDGEIIGPEEHARQFDAIWNRWPKRSGRRDAEAAFREAIRGGADIEAVARGAAAYVTGRLRDRRGPAAVIQFTSPLARWLSDKSWEAWQGLPDAEHAAQISGADDLAGLIERAKRREAARLAMPF